MGSFISNEKLVRGPVAVVAVVGEDFPKEHLRLLKKLGVDVSGVQVEKGKTFRWSGYYGYDLNSAKTLKTELNVFQSFKPRIAAGYRKSRTVLRMCRRRLVTWWPPGFIP